jgi:iron complex transport system substrate-binding protein
VHDRARPQRVVSMNVCTDYLALLLAAPGQLRSVTWLARDPWLNPLSKKVSQLHVNRGGTEEVLPLHPDLVLAGTTTTRQTVQLMQRLGLRVVQVPYVSKADDIARNVRMVAAALGRQQAGEAVLVGLRQRMQRLEGVVALRRSAVVLGAGGRVSGAETLPGSILERVGLRHIAPRMQAMHAEDLLFARPDLIVLSPPRLDRPSLAQQAVEHPALRHLRLNLVRIHPAWWTCEGPHAADAAERLVAAAS